MKNWYDQEFDPVGMVLATDNTFDAAIVNAEDRMSKDTDISFIDAMMESYTDERNIDPTSVDLTSEEEVPYDETLDDSVDPIDCAAEDYRCARDSDCDEDDENGEMIDALMNEDMLDSAEEED